MAGRVGGELGSPIPTLIGSGPAMEAVYRMTRKAAASKASVLLMGETGTGKELIATALHRLSQRNNGPLVKVNCGALTESLLESELFGHVRGAFTGAVSNRIGRFEAAHGGTIFLDEIDSVSTKLQVKLLRVLQEREFERVGDTQTVRVDVRVIAASNRDLAQEVDAGAFREDLYWRLNVIPIQIPPLRERREDILPLVLHFLGHYNEVNDRYVSHVDPDAIAVLRNYPWPGNVRELQNYVERAVIMAERDILSLDLLPPELRNPLTGRRTRGRAVDLDVLAAELAQHGLRTHEEGKGNLFDDVVQRVERQLIIQGMASSNQVQSRAAQRLGINRNTLHKKLRDFGLESG